MLTSQEINSSTGKSNNLQQELELRGDLSIPFCNIRRSQRWGKPVSSASLSGYHPPTGRQTQGDGSLGKADRLVSGLTAILTKYKSNLWQSDNRDEGVTRCNWIRFWPAGGETEAENQVSCLKLHFPIYEWQDTFRIFLFLWRASVILSVSLPV